MKRLWELFHPIQIPPTPNPPGCPVTATKEALEYLTGAQVRLFRVDHGIAFYVADLVGRHRPILRKRRNQAWALFMAVDLRKNRRKAFELGEYPSREQIIELIRPVVVRWLRDRNEAIAKRDERLLARQVTRAKVVRVLAEYGLLVHPSEVRFDLSSIKFVVYGVQITIHYDNAYQACFSVDMAVAPPWHVLRVMDLLGLFIEKARLE